MKDWPDGSYIVFNINYMVLGKRPLLAIGCNYNSRKVLSFFAKAGSLITMLGIPYLLNYPEQFYNDSILSLARPLLMSKFFGSVNDVELHNKSHM